MVGSAGAWGRWAWLLLRLLGLLSGWGRPGLGGIHSDTPALAYDLHLHAPPRQLRTPVPVHTPSTHTHALVLSHLHIGVCRCTHVCTRASPCTHIHVGAPHWHARTHPHACTATRAPACSPTAVTLVSLGRQPTGADAGPSPPFLEPLWGSPARCQLPPVSHCWPISRAGILGPGPWA